LVVQIFLLSAMLADSLAIAAQAMVGETAGQGEIGSLHDLSKRLARWGVVAGLILAMFVAVGRYGLALLASAPEVADLTIEAGGIAAAIEPVAALVFVADGIFLGLLAFGMMVISTGTGAVAAIGLMVLTPMGDSLPGVWWALGVMMMVRGLVFVLTYRRSAEIAVRS